MHHQLQLIISQIKSNQAVSLKHLVLIHAFFIRITKSELRLSDSYFPNFIIKSRYHDPLHFLNVSTLFLSNYFSFLQIFPNWLSIFFKSYKKDSYKKKCVYSVTHASQSQGKTFESEETRYLNEGDDFVVNTETKDIISRDFQLRWRVIGGR